jgi:hypothetical protein
VISTGCGIAIHRQSAIAPAHDRQGCTLGGCDPPTFPQSLHAASRKQPLSLPLARISVAALETDLAELKSFGVLIAAGLLILKVRSELDYAGAEILDRLTISWKWYGTCSEERIDCGSACMVEEVKELCD